MLQTIKKGSSSTTIKKQIQNVLDKTTQKKINEFAGKLKTEIVPMDYQIKMRNEWE
ncbi:MAG: hypothetical protein SFY32_06695 [Bacteroidota bacterium]|nr:hypothetical protein [Bacteroidota bacterium]